MDSHRIGLSVGISRPTEIAEQCMGPLSYVASLADLAAQEVQAAVSTLEESRGVWDYLRATLTNTCAATGPGSPRELLERHGVNVNRRTQGDRFWFTLEGCSYSIRLCARPLNAPPLPESGVVTQGAFGLEGAEGPEGQLYLMLALAPVGLESSSLALVRNRAGRWWHEGVDIVEEVAVHSLTSATISLPPVPQEHKDHFRDQMRRAPVSSEQSAETYEQAAEEQASESDAREKREQGDGRSAGA